MIALLQSAWVLSPKIYHPSKTKVLKSTQNKKFEPNALWFTYENLKSCKPHEKQTITIQNARFIDEKLKAQSFMFFILSFVM